MFTSTYRPIYKPLYRPMFGKGSTSKTPQFISIWDTTQSGVSASNQITVPTVSGGTYNCKVYWDGVGGEFSLITTWDDPAWTHTYPTEGEKNLIIEGVFTGLRFADGGDKLKIGDVLECGPLRLVNQNAYFEGCLNLDFALCKDVLNLEGVVSLRRGWNKSGVTNGLGNMDTRNITDFSQTLRLSQYIGDLNWNMAEALTIEQMMQASSNFNGDVTSLSMPKCVTWNQAFRDTSVDQNLGGLMPFSMEDATNILSGAPMSVVNTSDTLIGYAAPTQPLASGTITSFSDNGASGTKVTTSASLPNHIVDGFRIVQSGTGKAEFNGIFFDIFNVNNAAGTYDINVLFGAGGTGGAWDFDGVVLQPGVPFGLGTNKYNLAGEVAANYLTDEWGYTIESGGLAPP